MKPSGKTKRIVLGVALSAAFLAALPGQAQEQRPEPPAGRTEGAGGQRQGRRWNREQIRDRFVERYQRVLEMDGAAWEAIRDDVEKVVDLSLQLRAGAWMRGRRNQATAAEPASAVETCLQELRDVLGNPEAAADLIREKLEALRLAQAAAREELAEAQAALEAKLTPRQQGMLLLRGLLE